jgi:hypothetical protein
LAEEQARAYAEHFHAGRAVIVVKPGARARDAEEIVRQQGGYDIHMEPQSPIQTGGPYSSV